MSMLLFAKKDNCAIFKDNGVVMSILETIHNHEELAALPEERLPELAAEIRKRLVEVVSARGGAVYLFGNLNAFAIVHFANACSGYGRRRTAPTILVFQEVCVFFL